jgi:hypothetical protein
MPIRLPYFLETTLRNIRRYDGNQTDLFAASISKVAE